MRRLQRKIWFWVGGILAATFLSAGGAALWVQREILLTELRHTGKALADTVASFCVETLLEADYPYLETYVRKAAEHDDHVVFIKVWASDPEHTPGTLVAQHPPPEVVAGVSSPYEEFHSDVIVQADGVPDETLGRVAVALSRSRVDLLLSLSVWQLGLGVLILVSLLALVLGAVLRRSVLRPIQALDAHARRIGTGNLDEPVELRSDDELGRLASTMESMRQGMKESYARIQRQVEELKSIDRMKDEFLATTSHELRTPLNGIIGFTQALLRGTYGDVQGEHRDPLERISACSLRLLKMTESILEFSRLRGSSAAARSPLERHDLSRHLDEALVDVRFMAQEKGLEFRVAVPPDMQVKYRRWELEQLVRVFADNAVKYTQRGRVELLAQRWEGKRVEGFQLAVRDTGCGIAPELQRTVFEPFVQGFAHETRQHGGFGLGLAIAKRLEAMLGGRIVLESEPGKGSTFTVLLPATDGVEDYNGLFVPWEAAASVDARLEPSPPAVPATVPVETALPVETVSPVETASRSSVAASAAAPTAAASAPLEAMRGARPRLLVVDDEPNNVEILWRILRKDYDVVRAEDGPRCLEVLRREPVDVVLLDVMMPRMSGYDVLGVLREEGILEKVRVIVFSAKTGANDIAKARDLGASDYVTKPFNRDELMSRIQNLLKVSGERGEGESAALEPAAAAR
jgi:two-component system sensor histidine kinase ChiS